MKKKLLIPLVVFLVVAGIGAAVTYWPRPVPWDECSELYRRYADSPGIDASYIKDYRVNDTLTLCATLLEATTDSAWTELQTIFKVSPLLDIYADQLESGLDVLVYVPSYNAIDSVMNGDDFAVLSLKGQYACVLYIEDPELREGIANAIVDRIFNSLNNKSKF